MLRARAGFTLAEVIVALALTSIIGAAVTGVFITQSKFFDTQEKVSFARGVSRGATNIMMSEMRMLEQAGGVVSATNKRVTIRAPYAMGIVCAAAGTVTISRFPADVSMMADSGYSGYAFRNSGTGKYTYVTGGAKPVAGLTAVCTTAQIATYDSIGGAVEQLVLPGSGTPVSGDAVLLFQQITYEFKASTVVPGSIGLWRRIDAKGVDEELVAPFDTTAGFRFYVNNGATAQTAVPGTMSDITGFELILDGLSERPSSDGTHQSVPNRTSVFFKNQ